MFAIRPFSLISHSWRSVVLIEDVTQDLRLVIFEVVNASRRDQVYVLEPSVLVELRTSPSAL